MRCFDSGLHVLVAVCSIWCLIINFLIAFDDLALRVILRIKQRELEGAPLMEWGTILLVLTIVVLVVWLITIYNTLVAYANRYKNALAQIEVQLKRRYDLIPNLVETAKAYMSHEKTTLEAVTSARNEAAAALSALSGSGGVSALAAAETALQGALSKLSVTMEAYPDLKASENMQQLTEELTTTENRVAFARQGYNDSVMTYNTYRQSFPAVVVAGRFGHGSDAELLEFEDSGVIQAAPKVSF